MSGDSSDVEIKIFGTVSGPEAIWELAQAATNEGLVNFHTTLSANDFMAMLDRAAEEGGPVTLTKGRTTNLFEETTAACQEAGLSYVVHTGASGGSRYSEGFAWRPGMRSEYAFDLGGEGGDKPVIPVDIVRNAAKNGPEAVAALVERVTEVTSVGRIEFSPEFKDAFKAFEEAGETYGGDVRQSPAMV